MGDRATKREAANARPAVVRPAVVRPAVGRTVARFEAFQHRLMAAHAEEFATVDLTMAQAKLLYVVMATGELSLTEIAARLRVTPSTASGAVDHLVGLGLLARADDPANRRQIRVSITRQGLETIERISELGVRQMTALFSVITDSELRVLERAIGILSDAVTTLEADAAADTAADTAADSTPRSAE